MGVRERCVLSELVCVCGAGSLDGRNQDGHKGNSSRREFLCVLYVKYVTISISGKAGAAGACCGGDTEW